MRMTRVLGIQTSTVQPKSSALFTAIQMHIYPVVIQGTPRKFTSLIQTVHMMTPFYPYRVSLETATFSIIFVRISAIPRRVLTPAILHRGLATPQTVPVMCVHSLLICIPLHLYLTLSVLCLCSAKYRTVCLQFNERLFLSHH